MASAVLIILAVPVGIGVALYAAGLISALNFGTITSFTLPFPSKWYSATPKYFSPKSLINCGLGWHSRIMRSITSLSGRPIIFLCTFIPQRTLPHATKKGGIFAPYTNHQYFAMKWAATHMMATQNATHSKNDKQPQPISPGSYFISPSRSFLSPYLNATHTNTLTGG